MRRTDYLLHFLVGIVVAMTFYRFGLGWAVGAVVLSAAGKEIYDKLSGKGTPEIKDFLSTLAGGIIGIALEVISDYV